MNGESFGEREPDYYDLHYSRDDADQAHAREALAERRSFLGVNQAGHVKGTPSESAFCALPQSVVRKIGLTTHMGARIDLALLSTLLYWYQRNLEAHTYTATTGDEVALAAGEFCLSIQSIAEDVYERWFGERFEEPQESPSFKRFYALVYASVRRLSEGGWVQRLRYAVEGNKCTGIVWTFDSTPLEAYGKDRPEVLKAHPVLGHGLKGLDKDAPLVNCVDLIGEAFRNEQADVYRCRFTEIVCEPADELRRNHTLEHEDREWAQAVASGVSGERHMRIGSFPRGRVGSDRDKTLLPWTVLEIDADDFEESLGYAKAFVEVLWEKGVRGMSVAHSGNRSAHVRIPSGAFGNSVFRDWKAAKRTLTELVKMLCEETGVPESAVDFAALDPRHLIRLPGSTRQLKETRRHKITRRVGTGGREEIKNARVSVFEDAETPYGAQTDTALGVLSHIATGVYKKAVMSYREGKGQKKGLPLVTFAGVFSHRRIESLREHSGILTLDYDDVPNVAHFKAAVSKVPHTLAAFTSPSGEGVKVLVPVRVMHGDRLFFPDGLDHEDLFDRVSEAYRVALPAWERFLDKSGRDVSRGCFVSCDPEMYLNEQARPVGVSVEEREVIEEVVTGTARCTILTDEEAMGCEGEQEWQEAVAARGPWAYEDPRKVERAEALVLMLHHAADKAYGWRQRSMKDLWERLDTYAGGTAHAETVARIERGVAESERWGEVDQVGRTTAAFYLACAYVRETRSEEATTARMEKVNALFSPPLSRGVLRSQIRGAMNANDLE